MMQFSLFIVVTGNCNEAFTSEQLDWGNHGDTIFKFDTLPLPPSYT